MHLLKVTGCPELRRSRFSRTCESKVSAGKSEVGIVKEEQLKVHRLKNEPRCVENFLNNFVL